MAELGTVVALIKSMSGADPAVIEQAVTDWLDDHPEATTTVQDGSITEAKLASDVLAELGEIEGLKEAIENQPEQKNSTKTGVDLDVSDENGNVLLRLKDGHIQTKEFNSASVASASHLFNIFSQKKVYYHQNQEKEEPFIPAQSIFDVRYAHALGFDMIEMNTQLCSDGVYVCKHGSNGTLGAGIKDAIGNNDYSAVRFADVTSEWLRENVVYDSVLEKYCGSIPTLDEVCIECKKYNMKVKVGSLNAAYVAQKYLPDDMIWVTSSSRGSFTGTIERGWNKSTTTIDDKIAECKEIGAPLAICLSVSIPFSDYTDAEVKELVQKAHQNGFTVGINYPSPSDIPRCSKLGIDYFGSTNCEVNLFQHGTEKHIVTLTDSDLVLADGATYDSTDDVIEMPTDSSVYVSGSFDCGMTSLVVRFSGQLTLTVGFNSPYTELRNYESDGSEYVYIANVLPLKGEKWTKWFNLLAKANTTLYELTCDSEIIA